MTYLAETFQNWQNPATWVGNAWNIAKAEFLYKLKNNIKKK